MGCLRCMSRVKSFHVKILLLDKQELIQEVTETTTGQDLLDNIFKYLNLIETAYFGLRFQDNDNQTHWLDPKKKVCRQIRGGAPITLYLGVKFYAADPCRLVEEITRYQFFLQVKQDVLQGRLPVTQDLAVELAALSLQSELGDYESKSHNPGYVSDFRFISAQTEEFESDVEVAHASMTGMGIVPATAEMTYLEKVKWLDMYGVDLHPVIGEDNIEYFLGLTPSGIIVLRNRTKVGNYFWPRITKIYFKGKYFMLRVRDKNNDDSTYGFETPSRQACKHLWKCCVEHHAFFRLVQVSPSFVGTGVFSLGSRFRYSGHTEKQVMQQVQSVRRQQPEFTRKPSRRLSSRSHQPQSSTENQNQDIIDGFDPAAIRSPVVLSSLANGSLKRHSSSNGQKSHGRQGQPPGIQQSVNQGGERNSSNYNNNRTNSLPRHVSMMASSMRQQQPNQQNSQHEESLQDLSLQSLQWLESRGLYDNNATRQEKNNRRASLPEQIQANGYYRRRSHHNNGNGGQSDAESDASGISWASGLQQPNRRSRNESGSESERSVRRTHRSRRKRQGSYKLIESDEQFQTMQHHHRRSESEINQPSTAQRENQAPNQQQIPSRRSGYVNSGAETEVDANSQSIKRKQRRQRSRSRSPGDSRARLPPEVLQQLEFGLVEPNEETLHGEIPFTNVETASRHYYSRSRQLKTATTRSVVSAMEATTGNGLGNHPATASNAAAAPSPYTVAAERAVSERGLNRAETASIGNGSHMPRHRPMPPDPPQGGGQVIHHQNINLANSVPGIPGAGFPGMTSSALSYHQIDSRNSPNSQFIWPPQYVTTSTPVTNSSQSSNSSPLRNPAIFQNHAGPHNIVGLPVTSTQYKSPYAVPQSSSGSSASATFKDPVYKQQLPPTVLMQQHQQPSQHSPRHHGRNTGASTQLNGNSAGAGAMTSVLADRAALDRATAADWAAASAQASAGRLPPPPPPPMGAPMGAPPIYSKYLQQQHQNRVVRSNGFATVPSGDEMSTEL